MEFEEMIYWVRFKNNPSFESSNNLFKCFNLEFGNKANGTPYETLVYATGPGYWSHQSNQTNETFIPVETMLGRNEPKYAHLSAIPMSDAVHSGEDVAVFATGKGSNLIQGIFEQNYIAYCISYAACIGPVAHKNPSCTENNI